MEQMYKHTDLFLTHTWRTDLHGRENHARVGVVNEELNRLGFSTWFDEKSMSGDIKAKMAEGVDYTKCVIVFVTEQYMLKIDSPDEDNCKFEFDRALTQKTKENILCVVMEEKLDNPGNWFGKLKESLGGCLFVPMFGDLSDKHYLKQQLQSIVDQLKAKGVVPSQTKNKCEYCTVTNNKSGGLQPLFGDGNACTFCGEDLKKTTDPKNYCVKCNVHCNGSFCKICKVNLLDKNQRIRELEQQLLKIISLELNVDLSKYDVEDFKMEIEEMKEKVLDTLVKREQVETSGIKLEIKEADYNKKVGQLQEKMEGILKSTSHLTTAKEDLQNIEPSYTNKLSQFKDMMHSLEDQRKDFQKCSEQLSRGKEELQKLKKEVEDFTVNAVEGEKHLHGKSCSCDDCVFERELTSKMITEGTEKCIEQLIRANEIEKVKRTINLKSEIKALKRSGTNLLLSLAVHYGTVEMLTMLLKEAIYFDIKEMHRLFSWDIENNIFTNIIMDNKVRELQLLIESQSNIVEAKYENDFGLLMSLTMEHGTVDMLIMLSEMGAQIKIDEAGKLLKTFGENNLLRKMISGSDFEGLKKIIKVQSDIINVKYENGSNVLLLLTVQHGTVKMFNKLLELGMRADEINDFHKTLLHHVKIVDIAHLLCEKYGDALLKIKDRAGFTPFMLAHHNNESYLLEALKPFVNQEEEISDYNYLLASWKEIPKHDYLEQLERDGFSYLKGLIKKNNITIMETLLTFKPDVVNMKNEYDNDTPLLKCCMNGSIEMLKLLINRGSDVNKCDTWSGTNALIHAVRFNTTEWCQEIVEYLCTTQPQLLTMESKYGESVFHYAAFLNKENLVPILLNYLPPPQLLLLIGRRKGDSNQYSRCMKTTLKNMMKIRRQRTEQNRET